MIKTMEIEGFEFDEFKITRLNKCYAVYFFYLGKETFATKNILSCPIKLFLKTPKKFALHTLTDVYQSTDLSFIIKFRGNKYYDVILNIDDLRIIHGFRFGHYSDSYSWRIRTEWEQSFLPKSCAKELKKYYVEKGITALKDNSPPLPIFQELNTQILQSLGSRICVLLDSEKDEETITLMEQFRKHYEWYCKQHEATQEETTERKS